MADLAPAARALVALAQQVQVRWEQAPRGTLRRGLVWIQAPKVVAAVVVLVVAATVALALYRRLKRR